MRVAASAARGDDFDAARTQIKLAEAWLRRWSKLDDRDRSRWQLEADDIAAYAEALFYLDGPNTAGEAVRRWRPKRFAIQVAEHLAEAPWRSVLVEWISRSFLKSKTCRLRLRCILAVLFRNGESVAASQFERVSRQLIEHPPADLSERGESWPLELIEQAASVIDDADLLDLIEALRPVTPDGLPDIGLGDWEISLRFALS